MTRQSVWLVCAIVIYLAESQAAFANKANDLLTAKSTKDRNAALAVFLQSSGESCGTVTRSFFQGIDKKSGAAFWNVTCTNKKSYAIMINDDASGSTRILECSVLKAIGASECFKKF